MSLRVTAAANYSNTFWDETFWFPKAHGAGWKDLKKAPESFVYIPQIEELYPAFLVGIGLVYIRYLFETFCFFPLGKKYGVLEKSRKVVISDPKLEAVYHANTLSRHHLIKTLTKETDLTRRHIETWLRRRGNMDQPVPLQKFGECCWLLLVYTFLFIVGINVLWDQPFFGNASLCWKGWPNQHVSSDLFQYYFWELSFYWSSLIMLFKDTKRKEFKLMSLHHVSSIILIFFSWIMNLVRIGSLIIFVHDASYIFLHVTKLLVYCKKDKARDISFVIFVAVWTITRLIIYPYVLLYSSTVDVFTSGMADESWGAYRFFNFFLYLLQGLHIIWSYMILKIIYRKFKKGISADVRSDSEDSEN